MRKIVVLCLCIAIGIAAPIAMADTVLLYTVNDDFHPEDYKQEDESEKIPSVAIIEDGVMSLFFDKGHIIFNAGFTGKVDNRPKVEARSLQLAKQGGANLLLEVNLQYETVENGVFSLPATASYRLISIPSEEILTQAQLETNDFKVKRTISDEEICFQLGQAIAVGALSIRKKR